MAQTFTAQADGNWSSPSTWTRTGTGSNTTPGAGDTVYLGNNVVTADIAIIPAGATSGSTATWLAALYASTNSPGYLYCNGGTLSSLSLFALTISSTGLDVADSDFGGMIALDGGINFACYCTTFLGWTGVQRGTPGATIVDLGAASIIIYCGTMQGGATLEGYGLDQADWSGTCPIVIVGNVVGGNAQLANAIFAGGSVTVTGSVSGGSALNCYGIYLAPRRARRK